jgi:hypothetical protein
MAIFASFAPVHPDERHGIQVYDGARLDTEETDFMREIGESDGYCFRTPDSMEKVTAFYNKQPGLTSPGSDKTGARYIKEENGHTVYIIIANP